MWLYRLMANNLRQQVVNTMNSLLEAVSRLENRPPAASGTASGSDVNAAALRLPVSSSSVS